MKLCANAGTRMFGSSIAKPMSKVRVFGVLIAFWTGKDETVTAGSPRAFTFFTRISNGAILTPWCST